MITPRTLMLGLTAILIAGASTLTAARQARAFTVHVGVYQDQDGECQLSTDTPYLRVRPSDTITFEAAVSAPTCVSVEDRPQAVNFLPRLQGGQTGQGVPPPITLNAGGPYRNVYRVNSGRAGRYKYSITMGSLVLDPELEIGDDEAR
jgi:hypothetical protein